MYNLKPSHYGAEGFFLEMPLTPKGELEIVNSK